MIKTGLNYETIKPPVKDDDKVSEPSLSPSGQEPLNTGRI
jgi:hypothetical protein